MHTRRKFLTHSSVAIGAFSFLKPLQSIASTSASSGETQKLTILFTNGFNSHFADNNATGGIDAVKKTVLELRRKHRNILLVDSGNILAGNSSKTLADLHLYANLKETGYDAITPGRTDMQHGADYFAKLVERSKVKAVATNYTEGETLFSHRIVRKGALKVGIIGIGNANDLQPDSFAKLLRAASEKAKALKEKNNCQLVVCLSHLPLINDKNKLDNLHFSKGSTAIDVVISANDDRFIYNTYLVKNSTGYDVLLSHAGKSGSMMGKLDVCFNEQGEKTLITTEQVFTGDEKVNTLAQFKKHYERQMA